MSSKVEEEYAKAYKVGAGFTTDATKAFQSPYGHLRCHYPDAYKRLVTLQEIKDAPPRSTWCAPNGLGAQLAKHVSQPNLRLSNAQLKLRHRMESEAAQLKRSPSAAATAPAGGPTVAEAEAAVAALAAGHAEQVRRLRANGCFATAKNLEEEVEYHRAQKAKRAKREKAMLTDKQRVHNLRMMMPYRDRNPFGSVYEGFDACHKISVNYSDKSICIPILQ